MACIYKTIPALDSLIEQLHMLSKHDFPSADVTKLLNETNLSSLDLMPYTFYSQDSYTRNQVYKSHEFELILMCWQPGQKSCVHGHEGQKCWMKVIDGCLEFTDYDDSTGQLVEQSRQIGQLGFVDGPAYIHGVRAVGNQSSLSLHLYARPFNQCDAYKPDDNEKKRIKLSYHSIDGVLVI